MSYPTTTLNKIFKVRYVPDTPVNSLSDTSKVSQFTYLGITNTLFAFQSKFEGLMNLSGNRITNIGTPTNPSDATSKQYVDTLITTIEPIYINVKTFGAIGNGIHDDTIAFKGALSLAASTGSSVFIPSGTWFISDTLELLTNVTLQGTSSFTCQIKTSITDRSLFTFSNNTCLKDISIYIIEQYSTSSPITTNTNPVCLISNCNTVVLNNINFGRVFKAISIGTNSNNITLNEITFSVLNCGIQLGTCSNIKMTQLQHSITDTPLSFQTYSKNNAIVCLFDRSQNVLIQSSTIDGALVGIQFPLKTSLLDTIYATVSTCRILQCTTGIQIQNYGLGLRGLQMNETYFGQSTTTGIHITETGSNIMTISMHQCFMDCTSRGIYIQSATSTCIVLVQFLQIIGQSNEGIRNESTSNTLKLHGYLCPSGTRLFNQSPFIEDQMTNISTLNVNSSGTCVFGQTTDVVSNTVASVVFKGGVAINKALLIDSKCQIGSGISTGLKLSIPNSTVTLTSITNTNLNTFTIDPITFNSGLPGTIIDKSATLSITGPNINGTNTSITKPVALEIGSGDILMNTILLNWNSDDVVKQVSYSRSVSSNTLYSVVGLLLSTCQSASIDLILVDNSSPVSEFFQITVVKGSAGYVVTGHTQSNSNNDIRFANTLFTITSVGQLQFNLGSTTVTSLTVKWRILTLT